MLASVNYTKGEIEGIFNDGDNVSIEFRKSIYHRFELVLDKDGRQNTLHLDLCRQDIKDLIKELQNLLED